MKFNNTSSRKNVRGQGMSEYLIIVALIAVAGIAVMGLFGGAARNQVAGLATELSGGNANGQIAASAANAATASAEANTDISLGNYDGRNDAIQ